MPISKKKETIVTNGEDDFCVNTPSMDKHGEVNIQANHETI